jgi:hypothetical protein
MRETADGIRERKKAPTDSKSAAQRWADARERVLLTHGKPKPIVKEEVPEKTTLEEFAWRFLERYAKANRLKPSGIASTRTILDVHLIPAFGDGTLDTIRTEDVQELKAKLAARSPKTVNNVLTTLSVLLKTAVDWGAIERLGCSIKLLRTPKSASSFCDFEEYERLVEISRTDAATHLAVLLEARLGCAAARSWRWSGLTST